MPITSKPAYAVGEGGLRNIVQLGGERPEATPINQRSQAFALGREHEQEARRQALEALGLSGAAAFNQAALASHNARLAVALMGGGHV